MGRLSTCLVALSLFAGPASACINDIELPNHEREFRSHYGKPPRPVPLASANPTKDWVLFGGGATLLASALVLAFVGARSRA